MSAKEQAVNKQSSPSQCKSGGGGGCCYTRTLIIASIVVLLIAVAAAVYKQEQWLPLLIKYYKEGRTLLSSDRQTETAPLKTENEA
ncbi:hypothetical protein ACOME3_001472 [Neoechinorhynchus agilis]